MANNSQLPATAQPNGLTITGQAIHSSNLPALTVREKALAKELRSLSLCGNASFPIADAVIAMYTQKLVELSPTVEPQSIRVAINSIIMGFSNFNPNAGIQNMIASLRDVKRARERLTEKGNDKPEDKELLSEVERLYQWDKQCNQRNM